jgi:hypothetical protein
MVQPLPAGLNPPVLVVHLLLSPSLVCSVLYCTRLAVMQTSCAHSSPWLCTCCSNCLEWPLLFPVWKILAEVVAPRSQLFPEYLSELHLENLYITIIFCMPLPFHILWEKLLCVCVSCYMQSLLPTSTVCWTSGWMYDYSPSLTGFLWSLSFQHIFCMYQLAFRTEPVMALSYQWLPRSKKGSNCLVLGLPNLFQPTSSLTTQSTSTFLLVPFKSHLNGCKTVGTPSPTVVLSC